MFAVALVVGGIAALAALVASTMAAWRRNAYFGSLLFIDDGGQDAIWIFERLASTGAGYHDPQLALLSIAESRRRVVYSGGNRERVVFLGDSGRFLWWWSSRGGLHTRDRTTGAVILDEAALLARVPALEGKLIDRHTYDACNNYAQDWPSRGVRVRTSDARVRTITAELAAAPSDAAWAEVDNSHDVGEGASTIAEGTLRDGRTIALWGKDRQKPRLGKHELGDDTYLEGRLVRDDHHGRVLELDAPPAVLIAHRDKLGSGANLLVSRVGLDGTCQWTHSETDYRATRERNREVGELAYAAVRDDGVYLVINRVPYCVLVVDPATGDVRRRFPA